MGRIAELEAELARTRDMLHDAEAENLQRRAKRSRPDLLKGATRRVETPLGTMYVNITEDDKGQPFEVFISLGKAGAPLMADVEAIGRLISLALRSGIPIREVYRQLRGIRSEEHTSELQSPDQLVCRLLLEKKKAQSRLEPSARFLTEVLGFRRGDTYSTPQQSSVTIFEVGHGGAGAEVHVETRPERHYRRF